MMILAVTNDEIEQIVYIADSKKAMSRLCGVPSPTISRQCNGLRKSRGKLKFIEIDDDDDETILETI